MTSHASTMELSGSRYARTTAREFAVLGVAAVGAYLFFIHGSLYLQSGSIARPLTLEGFLLVTAILYLFLRLNFAVAGLYYPRRTEHVVCEECGRAVEPTAPHEATHGPRTNHPRRPTEKEVLAAVLLRRAIDDARRSSQKDLVGRRPDEVRVPGDIENVPVPIEEFRRILKQLDSPRGGEGPGDRRPKGPA